MPKNAKTTNDLEVKIPALKLQVMNLELVGVSSLITHKFSDKGRKQMADKQAGAAQHKKMPKNPVEEFKAAMYVIDEKKKMYGFPASGFKMAAVSATKFSDNLKASYVRGAFHVLNDIVHIKSDPPLMRQDTVRVGGMNKVADLRYRPEFKNWRCTLKISYNAAAITPAQIAHLFNIAGFAVGVGEWRPEKRGSFGMFQVAA